MKLKIQDKSTSEILTAYVETWDINHNGNYEMCYLIGVENYTAFHCRYIIYSNKQFNKKFTVLETHSFRPMENGFYK